MAALESQLKEKPFNSVPHKETWQEVEFQLQPLDGSVSNAGTGATDFQPPMSIVANDSTIASSQSMFYNSFYESFDASSALPEPDISAALVSTASTSVTSTLEPHQFPTGPFQGHASNDDTVTISQEHGSSGSTRYMTTSAFSSADNTFSNLLESYAWDDLPPDDTVTDPPFFNDEAYVTIPGLSVIRAHVNILQRMHQGGGKIDFWNPFAVSPFYQSDEPFASTPPLAMSLPDNYHPMALQKVVKHHPVFDLLPWPSVRSKILHILTLPMEVRPQRARGDLATVTMQLMFDMKDAGGGLRVWGSNPFDEDNWEVGPVFFQQWWWALNSEIVKRSNHIRTQRGEDTLRLTDVSR